MRRDRKRDFASASGAALLRAKIEQVLMTEGSTPRSAGELPWRTNFGAALTLLRHQRNDTTLRELARVHVRDALRRWAPGVDVVSLEIAQHDASITIQLRVREGETTTSLAMEVRP